MRRFLQISKKYVFLENNMGLVNEKMHDLLIFVQTELML